jgi:hypothetical protein
MNDELERIWKGAAPRRKSVRIADVPGRDSNRAPPGYECAASPGQRTLQKFGLRASAYDTQRLSQEDCKFLPRVHRFVGQSIAWNVMSSLVAAGWTFWNVLRRARGTIERMKRSIDFTELRTS